MIPLPTRLFSHWPIPLMSEMHPVYPDQINPSNKQVIETKLTDGCEQIIFSCFLIQFRHHLGISSIRGGVLVVLYSSFLAYRNVVKHCPEVGIDTGKSVECPTPKTWPSIKRSERSYFFDKPKAKIVPSTAIVVDRCQSRCLGIDFYTFNVKKRCAYYPHHPKGLRQ